METVACGEIGLEIDYFYSLTPREYYNIVRGYRRKQESRYKNSWIQTRELMQAVLMPHIKKGVKLDLPLPWENQTKVIKQTPEEKAQAEEFWQKVDNKAKL